jgi:hypothetical protein
MESQIKIVYTPNIESLMKVSKYLLRNLKVIKYGPIYVVCLLLLLYVSSHAGLNPGYNAPNQQVSDYIGFIIFPIVIVFVYFGSLATMKKTILNNKRNFETQNITFNNTSYTQEGETFKIENFWNETFQIKETKDWFLIYPKKNSAFPIVKADLKGNEYNELKALFNSLEIKKSLK